MRNFDVTNSMAAKLLTLKSDSFVTPKLYVLVTGCHLKAIMLESIFSHIRSNDFIFHQFDCITNELMLSESQIKAILSDFKEMEWCDFQITYQQQEKMLVIRPNFDQILKDIENTVNFIK